MPKMHVIKTSLPIRMEVQMKSKRRKIFLYKRSLLSRYLSEPTENEIIMRENIFITKKKASSSPHDLGML